MTATRSDELRIAWYSPASTETIAELFGVTTRAVNYFWKRERAAGRLPDLAKRPQVLAADKAAEEPIEDDDEGDDVMPIEDINAASSADSLAALRAAHGDDPPFFHVMPAAFLVGETATDPRNFDVDAHAMLAARILRRLKPYFRARDLLMRAYLKKKSERLAHGRQR